MKKTICLLLSVLAGLGFVRAQETSVVSSQTTSVVFGQTTSDVLGQTTSGSTDQVTSYKTSHAVEYNNILDNWYVQVGLDMSLQNPYGHNFAHVFPNGKTFGIDVAGGRWFTPELGLRGKVNWENGIRLFENGHANWLAPFYQPGKNMDRGGYISLVGDIQLDVHNLVWGYEAERKWNLQVFPRAGIIYNFGVSKGSPLIGIGIGNTYRLNDRYCLYLDVAYNGLSSGFVGVEKSTGIGSNFNGFFDIDFGVQFDLGKSGFRRVYAGDKSRRASNLSASAGDKNIHASSFADGSNLLLCESLWKGWFVQAGLDMSLQNPYGSNFAHVFPKGKTFGLDVALGRWFSPEVALRVRVNWENGFPLFENGHLEWVASNDGNNMDDGGYVATYMDVLLNMTNMLAGYDASRKWSVLVFPRAGLASNRSTKSGSPMVGFGVGCNRRLTDRWSVYADMAYQMITSEFFSGVSGTGMSVSTGHNGFFDFQVGAQFDLGK